MLSESKRAMKEMVFWGATGQAKVLKECMQDSGLELVALFDNDDHLAPPFPGIPLFFGKDGFEDWMKRMHSNDPVGFLVAIGGSRGRDRIEIQDYLQSRGLVPLIAKHRTAFIAENVAIGEGSQVLAQSSVCVETVVGRGCIINTGATVDHECRLHDGVHIGPGAHLAGCVKVERYAMVGTGAVVSPRVVVGEESVVGAGAVVTGDVPSRTVVVGNPARILREVKS